MGDRGQGEDVALRTLVMISSTISVATRILRLLWLNCATMRTLAFACLVATYVSGAHGFVGETSRDRDEFVWNFCALVTSAYRERAASLGQRMHKLSSAAVRYLTGTTVSIGSRDRYKHGQRVFR